MDYRRLGDSVLTASAVGLGCVTFGREIPAEMAFTIMDHAVARGIALFDTAEAYAAGASEQIVGQWLTQRHCRDRVILTTKVSGTLTRRRILDSANSSLNRLQTERVDLFLLHAGAPVPKGTRFDIIPGHQNIYFSDARFRVMEGLRAQAAALGVPMAQLAMAWVFGQPRIASVLVGARDTAHLDNALAARSMILPAPVRQALNDLSR
jgi:aryl-alcohol dehydrogenase-like predicted oxidoreductase